MKNNKFLNLATIALLSSTLVVGATSAFAQEARDVDTEGKIEFKTGSGEEEVVVVPPTEPEEPGIILPPVDPDPGNPEIPNTGPLTIAYVPNIDFGTHTISAQAKEHNALASQFSYFVRDEEGNITDVVSDDTTPYIHFAQVQDTRGTNEGWNLTVSMTEFATADADAVNETIDGAQINFKSAVLQNEGSDLLDAEIMEDLTLIPGQTATIMSAEEGKGAGVQSIVWGSVAGLETREEIIEDEEGEEATITVVENPFVTLDVPASATVDTAIYTTTLSWELAATPGTLGIN